MAGKPEKFVQITPEKQELAIAERLYLTNTYLAGVWSPDTVYRPADERQPDVAYEYKKLFPDGQCGPTNFLGGMVLAWYGLARPNEDEIFFEEGSLLTASGQLLSDHHAWIRVVGFDPSKQWRIDLAAGQPSEHISPTDDIRIVMQGVNHEVAEIESINYAFDPSTAHATWTTYGEHLVQHEGEWGLWYVPRTLHMPNAANLVYDTQHATPYKDFDAQVFGGRLEHATYRYLSERVQTHGRGAYDFNPENVWFPKGFDKLALPADLIV